MDLHAGIIISNYQKDDWIKPLRRWVSMPGMVGPHEKEWWIHMDRNLHTRKTTPCSLAERISKLKEVVRGWLNYFRMASIHGKLKELDSWLRNRLRYCIWEDWKKPERRRKNLIRLGVDQHHAYVWSRTRMGGWAARYC